MLIIRIKEKTVLVLLAAAAFLHMAAISGDAGPSVSASAAALMHEGRLLYDKNASASMPMASTTKLMTAIVVLENTSLEETVTVKDEHCGIEGSSMYLHPGDRKSVHELLKGLLLVSGNDAALALAHHVSGSTEDFVSLMNEKAGELGMKNSRFENPHGLSESGHYSSAYDLALLMEYCMDNEDFRDIIGMKSFECDGSQLLNHNKLLFIYDGCVGGKTGYTRAAGRCLVSCCEKEGARTVCVTLSAPDDWNDHITLYDWVYSRCSMRPISDRLTFSVPLAGTGKEAELVPEREIEIFAEESALIEVDARLPWHVYGPVTAGSVGGSATIYVDGQSLGEYYLIYNGNIR